MYNAFISIVCLRMPVLMKIKGCELAPLYKEQAHLTYVPGSIAAKTKHSLL